MSLPTTLASTVPAALFIILPFGRADPGTVQPMAQLPVARMLEGADGAEPGAEEVCQGEGVPGGVVV